MKILDSLTEDEKAMYEDIYKSISSEAEKDLKSLDDQNDDAILSSSQGCSTRGGNSTNLIIRKILPLLTLAIIQGVKLSKSNETKAEIKEEIKTEIKEEIKTEIKDEIVTDIKDVIKNEIKNDINIEISNELREEIKSTTKNEIKDELKAELMQETKAHIANSLTKVSDEMTHKNIKCVTSQDKRESFDRRPNIIFSGFTLETTTERNARDTTDKIVNELNNITGLNFTKEDLSACYRIFPKQGSTPNGPPPILVRFVSYQLRNKVLSHRTDFNKQPGNKFMNEDMTFLQHKLFTYLRTKVEVIIKKTVSYKDGKINFLTVDNAAQKKWSKVDNVLDLAKIDISLQPNLSDTNVLFELGLKDCKVNITLQ